MIIVNGFHPLTIITKRSILDVAAALDSPLNRSVRNLMTSVSRVSRRFTRMRNLSMVFYIFSRVDMHTTTLNSAFTQLRQYLKPTTYEKWHTLTFNISNLKNSDIKQKLPHMP